MKRILAGICACIMVLSLTGCDIPFFNKDDDPTDIPSQPSSSGEVIFNPNLYTMNTLLQKVYAAAGYDYSYSDPADGEAVLDAYVQTLGLTWRGVLSSLSGDNPGGDAGLMTLCKAVGISSTEVDWTSYDTLLSMPNTQPAAPKVVKLTVERDDFMKAMQNGELTKYREAIINAGGKIPATGSIDTNVFTECLNKDMTMSRIRERYQASKYVNSSQLLFKILESDRAYYIYTERNGHCYLSFYPTVTMPNGAGLYLRDEDGETGIPLWQEYFIAYAAWCENTYGVSLKNGIYNKINDGIEVWWPTNDGQSLELDVYESGLIRISRSTDPLKDMYTDPNTAKDSRISEEFYEWASTKYGLNATDVLAMYNIAWMFDLTFKDSNVPEEWKPLADIYVNGLYIIGTPTALSNFTVGDIRQCLHDILSLHGTYVTGSGSLTDSAEYDSIVLSALTFDEQRTVNSQIVQPILAYANAANSSLQIAGFNAGITSVNYVKPDDDRMEEYKEKYEKLIEDELVRWTFDKWVIPVMNYQSAHSASQGQWAAVNFDEFCGLIDKMEQLNISILDTFSEYFDKIRELSAFNRSDIIHTAVYNISELPDSVRHVYVHEGVSMTEAHKAIGELRTAIGSTYGGATEVTLIFEQKEDSSGSSGNSGTGSGDNLAW